jgi:hypothetical protein
MIVVLADNKDHTFVEIETLRFGLLDVRTTLSGIEQQHFTNSFLQADIPRVPVAERAIAIINKRRLSHRLPSS